MHRRQGRKARSLYLEIKKGRNPRENSFCAVNYVKIAFQCSELGKYTTFSPIKRKSIGKFERLIIGKYEIFPEDKPLFVIISREIEGFSHFELVCELEIRINSYKYRSLPCKSYCIPLLAKFQMSIWQYDLYFLDFKQIRAKSMPLPLLPALIHMKKPGKRPSAVRMII
jgi:hypothetical protein